MTRRAFAGLAAWCLAACGAAPPGAAAAAEPSPPGLPGFGGTFRGTLRLLGDAGVREVPMGLDVSPVAAPAGAWTWRLHYGEGASAQVRDYRLLVDDVAGGRYRIDEGGGLELQARAVDDELVSVFVVGTTTLVVRYRAVPEGIAFALESFDPAAAQATGGEVKTLGTFARQRALLRRTVGDRR